MCPSEGNKSMTISQGGQHEFEQSSELLMEHGES